MKVILVGPPRAGKSTYARELRAQGIPTYCGDPRSKVKDPEDDVVYLPECFTIGKNCGDRYIADHWFTMPGPWCCDGVLMVRALRKVLEDGRIRTLDDCRIVRFQRQYMSAITKPGQVTMAKAIDTVWSQVAGALSHITEYR